MSPLFLTIRRCSGRAADGFTLVELVTVMVLMGILSASFMMFFKPTIDGYFAARRRADLTDIADTALRRMHQDLKKAVPNSVFITDPTTLSDGVACFQFVPTIGGGRYRLSGDSTNDDTTCPTSGNCSKYPDDSLAATASQTFDVLLWGGVEPAKNQTIVINNQNGDDVYDGSSRAEITSATKPSPKEEFGTHRLEIGRNPIGNYADGNFLLVATTEPVVMYSCSGGKLYRKNLGDFTKAAACAADGDLLATDLQSCEFLDVGKAGYLWMTLAVSRNNETVRLAYGAHVDNQP